MHLMIDIETLGTGPDAVVLSCAMIPFGATVDELGKPVKFGISKDEQIEVGRVIDASTAVWWMKQAPAAIAVMAEMQENAVPLSRARGIIAETINLGYEGIWANDPDFDCTILRSLCPDIKWPFWMNRSVRTAKMIAQNSDIDLSHIVNPNAHDPEQDCYTQIRQVMEVHKRLAEVGLRLL